MSSNVLNVPKDIWRCIASFIHSEDRKQLAVVCKYLHEVVWSMGCTFMSSPGLCLSSLCQRLGTFSFSLAALKLDSSRIDSIAALESFSRLSFLHAHGALTAQSTAECFPPILPKLVSVDVDVSIFTLLMKEGFNNQLERVSIQLPSPTFDDSLASSLLTLPRLHSLSLSLNNELHSSPSSDNNLFRHLLTPLSYINVLHLHIRPRSDLPPTSFPSFRFLQDLSIYINFPSIELPLIASANPQLTSLSFVAFARAVETIHSTCLVPLTCLVRLCMSSAAVVGVSECYFEETILEPFKLLTSLSISHLRPWQLVPDASFLHSVLSSLRHLCLANERSYHRLVGPLARPSLMSSLTSLTLTDSSVSANELVMLFQDANFPELLSLDLVCSTATYLARLGTLIEVSCTRLTCLTLTVPHHLLSWTLPQRMPNLKRLTVNFYSVLPLHAPLSLSSILSLTSVRHLTLAHIGVDAFIVTTVPHWTSLYSLPLLSSLRLLFRGGGGGDQKNIMTSLCRRRAGIHVEGPSV